MLRKLSWSFLVISFISVLLAGLLTWLLHSLYSTTKHELIAELNRSLEDTALTIDCHAFWDWRQFQQNELCNVRHQQELNLQLKQQIRFLPWKLSAAFTLTPVYKGIHLESQVGHWQLPLGAKRLHFKAQAEGDFHTRKVKFDHWQMQGWLDLNAPFHNQLDILFSNFSLALQDEQLNIEELTLSLNSSRHAQQRFIDRSQIRFQKAQFITPNQQLEIHGFALQNANLKEENTLAILLQGHIQSAKSSSAEGDLRIDPTELSLYFDRFTLDFLPLTHTLSLATGISLNLKRFAEGIVAQAQKSGLDLHIEKFQSGLAYHDKTPNSQSLSGDFTLDGQIKLAYHYQDTDSIKLNVDLNRSLLLGPQVDLMLKFINQGWLYQRQQRLISRIVYGNGKLLANGQPVSLLAFAPPVYEEDHAP